MKRVVLLLTVVFISSLASFGQLPMTNRVFAAVDLSDPTHPKTELVFVRPDGMNFRAPLEEMTKHLQAGNRLITLDEYNQAIAKNDEQFKAIVAHDNDVVARYNELAAQYNQLASKRAQRQQAIATWMMLQSQNRPSATQPMEDLLRREQEKRIHCDSSTLGNSITTDCR